MLTLTNVALRRGSELLFENASLTIHRGNKVGLIGANGSGKSSLFEAILMQLDTDRGQIEYPTQTRIAHMAQEVKGSSQPAIDYVLSGDKVYVQVMEQLSLAEQNGTFDKIASLHEQLDTIDGYTARARAEQLMAGLGFSVSEFEQPLTQFSGGWRIRLNLAQTLMTPADLLLLDEPTNHLDLDAILWLSDWIRRFDGTLLLISHDREFLDECVGHIAYLHSSTIELFPGNYSAFERIKAERLAMQQSSYEKQQREILHMQDFVRRFRAKASKARQAQSRIKALERMELIAPAHVDSPFNFEIRAQDKVSSPLLNLADAVLGYDQIVLENVNLSFLPGDRYGLLGVNGAGKSTLIKTLNKALPLLSGARTEGANLNTAYFSQHQLDELDLGSSALQHLFELGRSLGALPREQEARNFLGGFNFRGDKVLDQVEKFSGGEKARLALALIAWTRPNLLLMDEPTNHLDIEMRQALTVALQSFAGVLVLVSHDRHLMANTVDQFLLVENGSVTVFPGDLTDYRHRVLPAGKPAPREAGTRSTDTRKSADSKTGVIRATTREIRQLKTRINTLDTRLERLQRKLSEVESELADPAIYSDRDNPALQPLLRDRLSLQAQLSEVETEWLDASSELDTLETSASDGK